MNPASVVGSIVAFAGQFPKTRYVAQKYEMERYGGGVVAETFEGWDRNENKGGRI